MKFELQGNQAEKTGGYFIKLKDGESIQGVLTGEPYQFRQIWAKGNTKYFNATDDVEGSSFRFRINMVIKENGMLVSKILEQSYNVFKQLQDLSSEYDLSRTSIKISRRGTGAETTYTILPLPNGTLDDASFASIDSMEKLDLVPKQLKTSSEGFGELHEAPGGF